MNNRLTAIPLALVLLASLSGCGVGNEAPCESFESAYNAADLHDKSLLEMHESYVASLEKLGEAAEDASADASGDVKVHIGSYAEYTRQYVNAYNDPEVHLETIEKRTQLSLKEYDIVDSCEESGNPIELEDDQPVG